MENISLKVKAEYRIISSKLDVKKEKTRALSFTVTLVLESMSP